MLVRVISGGQTGVDIAALRAAKACGIETGGTMPKKFMTEDGPRPAWAREFGLRESDVDGYLARTRQNVVDADATLRIAADFKSPGERVTWRFIVEHRKPHADVTVYWADASLSTVVVHDVDRQVDRVAAWIHGEGFRVLNVAGNRESKCPGIGDAAQSFLTRVFETLAVAEGFRAP